MKQTEVSDAMVAAVAAGIRDYNARNPFPVEITFDRHGKQVPLAEDAQAAANRRWHAAVRNGLLTACGN